MPTSEPELLESDAPANASDDAAATAYDKAAADKLANAAADDAAVDCPGAAYRDVACDPSNAVGTAPDEFADVTLVGTVILGCTIVETLNCVHVRSL